MKNSFVTILASCAVPALMSLLCSCAGPVVSDYTMKRIIAINDDGSPHGYPIERGSRVIPAEDYSYSNHVQSIIDSIRESGRTNILIYVFGGMNTLDETVERSANLSRAISETSDYYPILVNWESSLFDAYYDHLVWYRRGVRDPYLGPALSPFYLMADLGRAFTRLPINLVFQSYGMYANYALAPQVDEDDAAEIQGLRIRAYIGEDYTPLSQVILRQIVYTLGFPARVITTPLIDAGGKNAWDTMLRRTQTVFRRAHTIDITDDERFDIAFSPPDGALSILMDALVELYHQDTNYVFTLIGHSMGPIILNELICRYYMLPYHNIVYLAPSCTIREFGNSVIPYMCINTNCTFYNLCLHQNADANDMMWWVFLPRGSILEWIDTFLGDPLILTDLTLGKWENSIRSLPRLSEEFRSRVVIKAFGIDDPATNKIMLDKPEQHTDFGDPALRFWEPKFWSIDVKPSRATLSPP